MLVEIKIKVDYHIEGMFYTVRGKRLKDVESLGKMRNRITSIKNVKWKWHIVLTFNMESLNYWFRTYQNVGKALAMYYSKVRSKFPGVKYFWKYEEGTKVWCKACVRKVDFVYDIKQEGWVYCIVCKEHIKSEGELPHFHLLYDFINRGVRSKLDKIDDKLKKIRKVKVKRTLIKDDIYLLEWVEKALTDIDYKKLIHPHNWAKFDWKQYFINQRKYSNNRGKTDLEILVGYYHYRKWGIQGGKQKKGQKRKFKPTGIVYARKLRGYYDLKEYVKKDFFKFTEAKWLKKGYEKKWGHSQNLLYDEEGKEPDIEKEWAQVLETKGYFVPEEALKMVQGSKDNMIDFYDGKGWKGKYIYNRVINDIKDKFIVVNVEKEAIQQQLNLSAVGYSKCKHCEKKFRVGTGYIGLYCCEKHFIDYSRSIKFRVERDSITRKMKEKELFGSDKNE